MRQCRDRYLKYLAPDLVLSHWTEVEDRLLDEKFAQFGPRWKYLATFFPNRTDVGLKNRWQMHLRNEQKRLLSIISQRTKRWPLDQRSALPGDRALPVPIFLTQPNQEPRTEFLPEDEDRDSMQLDGNWLDDDLMFLSLGMTF
jgi:hypothetical protein